jgi:hypothetical protein
MWRYGDLERSRYFCTNTSCGSRVLFQEGGARNCASLFGELAEFCRILPRQPDALLLSAESLRHIAAVMIFEYDP